MQCTQPTNNLTAGCVHCMECKQTMDTIDHQLTKLFVSLTIQLSRKSYGKLAHLNLWDIRDENKTDVRLKWRKIFSEKDAGEAGSPEMIM